MIKTVQIIVSGKVQGVCYRASAQKIARQLQIDGWVKNLPDGRVEIRAQGDAQQRPDQHRRSEEPEREAYARGAENRHVGAV